MMFAARVECDSIAHNKKRLTTMVVTYPRFIHSEILTHRDRARNSASSRAIPWNKMKLAITEDPVIPIRWGSEQRGMQAGGEITDTAAAESIWLQARNNAMESAQQLADLGVHKSLVNRLTEPFMWITVVMTATEWQNFFRLRCHPDAEIHFQKIATMIRDAMDNSKPKEVGQWEWHLPFITQDDRDDAAEAYAKDSNRGPKSEYAIMLCKASVARCARVSYLTHDGERDLAKDLSLFDKLAVGSGFGHWSPHEHVAIPEPSASIASGPYFGWTQFRKFFPNENLPG